MLDKNGLLMVIDFGMAKTIDKKVIKERGLEPNINATLFDFRRKLDHYRIRGPKLRARVDEYMATACSCRKTFLCTMKVPCKE